jgi:hypothetical protein
LQGPIRAGNEAITYYNDKRLPFGLPGVNKAKKVSNAN